MFVATLLENKDKNVSKYLYKLQVTVQVVAVQVSAEQKLTCRDMKSSEGFIFFIDSFSVLRQFKPKAVVSWGLVPSGAGVKLRHPRCHLLNTKKSFWPSHFDYVIANWCENSFRMQWKTKTNLCINVKQLSMLFCHRPQSQPVCYLFFFFCVEKVSGG